MMIILIIMAREGIHFIDLTKNNITVVNLQGPISYSDVKSLLCDCPGVIIAPRGTRSKAFSL